LASPTRTQIATGTFTVSSTLTRYNTQISIPAAATTGIEVVFTVGAQTSGTWVIGNVQLEESSVATSFDYRPYGTELALAQRYYFRTTPGTSNIFGNAFNSTTTVAYGCVNFPVTMRSAPSALEQSGTAADYNMFYLATTTNCSSVPAFNVASVNSSMVVFTVSSGLTAGQGSIMRASNGTAYLAWSAEL
jgi:hypothetical protein